MEDDSPENYDDFTYANQVLNYAIVNHTQYSGQVRAQSTGGGALQWVVGEYYDHGYYDYWQSFYNNFFGFLGFPPTITNQWLFQWAHSFATFGQLDYQLTDKLQLTAGARWITEDKRTKNYAGFQGPTTRDRSDWPAENKITADKSWDRTIYHLSAKYQFTDDLMAYLSWSSGFHSGGFNS